MLQMFRPSLILVSYRMIDVILSTMTQDSINRTENKGLKISIGKADQEVDS